MSIEEAAELARRSIYHATFRDGASGGVASGIFSLFFNPPFVINNFPIIPLFQTAPAKMGFIKICL